jgi:hypothetical protein
MGKPSHQTRSNPPPNGPLGINGMEHFATSTAFGRRVIVLCSQLQPVKSHRRIAHAERCLQSAFHCTQLHQRLKCMYRHVAELVDVSGGGGPSWRLCMALLLANSVRRLVSLCSVVAMARSQPAIPAGHSLPPSCESPTKHFHKQGGESLSERGGSSAKLATVCIAVRMRAAGFGGGRLPRVVRPCRTRASPGAYVSG